MIAAMISCLLPLLSDLRKPNLKFSSLLREQISCFVIRDEIMTSRLSNDVDRPLQRSKSTLSSFRKSKVSCANLGSQEVNHQHAVIAATTAFEKAKANCVQRSQSTTQSSRNRGRSADLRGSEGTHFSKRLSKVRSSPVLGYSRSFTRRDDKKGHIEKEFTSLVSRSLIEKKERQSKEVHFGENAICGESLILMLSVNGQVQTSTPNLLAQML